MCWNWTLRSMVAGSLLTVVLGGLPVVGMAQMPSSGVPAQQDIARGCETGSAGILSDIPTEQLPAILAADTGAPDGMTDEQRAAMADLALHLGASDVQLRAFFRVIRDADVVPHRLSRTLVDIAERHKELLARIKVEPGDSPAVGRSKAQTRDALESGDFARADALLATIEKEQEKASGRSAATAAITHALRGDLALIRLRYREAAGHFTAAANRVPAMQETPKQETPKQESQRLGWLEQEADALRHYGNEVGDNAALVTGVERYQALLDQYPRENRPLDWARTQYKLGEALSLLGQWESDSGRLEQAVDAYGAALEECTRDRSPLMWAATQHSLGNVLAILGSRESSTDRLEQAVEAYRSALLEYTRERTPLVWAMIQNNLGNVLQALDEQGTGTERLEQAVEAYRAALLGHTRERTPLAWATIENNLGSALAVLGMRESGTERLGQAVEAYRAALEERTRERIPLAWAMTQNNLGNALQALGERERNPSHLEEAVAAHTAALEERTREDMPLAWAATQYNLGNALFSLGALENDPARLEAAASAYRSALLEYSRERNPLAWAAAQNNLGNALQALSRTRGDQETNSALLAEAVSAYRAALLEYDRDGTPSDWATIQTNLENALAGLNAQGEPMKLLKNAPNAEQDRGLLSEQIEAIATQ
jgi:tetratricopeptide (TPR) repeat protein